MILPKTSWETLRNIDIQATLTKLLSRWRCGWHHSVHQYSILLIHKPGKLYFSPALQIGSYWSINMNNNDMYHIQDKSTKNSLPL